MSTDTRTLVTQALAAGHTTVPDPDTGYQRAMYADCPDDGQPSPVRRVVHGAGHAITEVVMRCPDCGREFTAEPESLYLR
jgi:hypothetical protein